MDNFGMTQDEKEAREAEIKRREEEQAEEIAKREAAREPVIDALRAESILSEVEFNKRLAHFGEETVLNNAYAQAALLGKPYRFEHSSKDLW